MDEFLNRITAQRKVINIINKHEKFGFPLVGLSAKSIERWKKENSLSENSKLLEIIYLVASKLFFLANKSQEQITNEYRLLSKTVNELIIYLESDFSKLID